MFQKLLLKLLLNLFHSCLSVISVRLKVTYRLINDRGKEVKQSHTDPATNYQLLLRLPTLLRILLLLLLPSLSLLTILQNTLSHDHWPLIITIYTTVSHYYHKLFYFILQLLTLNARVVDLSLMRDRYISNRLVKVNLPESVTICWHVLKKIISTFWNMLYRQRFRLLPLLYST